jgi:hypothetical protein
MSEKRARIAYDTFRSGFDHDGRVPHWDDAPTWIRDVVIVAYLQGKLDAPSRTSDADH